MILLKTKELLLRSNIKNTGEATFQADHSDCQRVPQLMGIINITEDSFFDGGRYLNPDSCLKQAEKLIQDGADILDIGAESSRPGAKPVEEEKELERIKSFLHAFTNRSGIQISIDTSRSSVAKMALESGAHIINDIYALRRDPALVHVIKETGCKVVLMHMQGTPDTMQINPHYNEVIGEIGDFFKERIDFAVKNGINEDKIILDPGIGFGKGLNHNLTIIKRIKEFKTLGFPLLIGASRKSFIGNILNKSPQDRLYGTAAVVAYLAQNDVEYIRVHDVAEMKDVILVAQAIKNG
ncbi:MAG: dihydropteroate synthase [Candidatus Aureabacteria bacterium]|nr:dihydropteroate synthase [Candidatus Auribacterota bacterium]